MTDKNAIDNLKTEKELRDLVLDMQESLDEETISDAGFGFDAATKTWKERIEALLPAPPTPRTMDEIEWDDAEHHLSEAFVGNHEALPALGKKVIMLGVNNFGKIRSLDPESWETWSLSPGRLTPTGRKCLLVTGEDEKTSDDAEKTHGEVPCLLDRDGDHWVNVGGQWHMVDPDFAYDELPELYGPYRPASKGNDA